MQQDPYGGPDLEHRADRLVEGLERDPVRLAAIPSPAFPGSPPGPGRRAYAPLTGAQRAALVEHAGRAGRPDTAPVLHARTEGTRERGGAA
ncbi:hypothetical protein [Streptomyces sp. NPDC007088]|uniref:hypothetical protein n=1 Tax=Streptomyces sp. NPDC007088 TaxID=3364773 RepID=UPI0036B6CFD6